MPNPRPSCWLEMCFPECVGPGGALDSGRGLAREGSTPPDGVPGSQSHRLPPGTGRGCRSVLAEM